MVRLYASDPRWQEMDKLNTAFCAITNPHLQRAEMDVEPLEFRQIKLTLEECRKEYTKSEDFT